MPSKLLIIYWFALIIEDDDSIWKTKIFTQNLKFKTFLTKCHKSKGCSDENLRK
jgi:hypothetical protein